MSVFDPKSHEFQVALVATYQAMLQGRAVTGEVEASVVLVHFGDGEGTPRYRPMSVEDWRGSRALAGNAAWTPVARVEVDGSVVRLL